MTERSFAPIIVREWCYGLSMSRWLNVADPDHLPHFSVSSAVNRPKSAGEPANACSAEVDKTTFDFEIDEVGIDVLIAPLDDLGRRVPGRVRCRTSHSHHTRANSQPGAECPAAHRNETQWIRPMHLPYRLSRPQFTNPAHCKHNLHLPAKENR